MYKSVIKVKRSMVFWFDDGVYNKTNPVFTLESRDFHSFIIAGKRPYLVISSDDNNLKTCTVAPITSSKEKVQHSLPCHVNFEYRNDTYTILLDQIRTVDILTLGNYIYTLGEDIMSKVELSIINHFNIKTSSDLLLSEMLVRLEPVINKLVQDKVEKIKYQINASKAEDFALLIGQNLEQLFSVDAALPVRTTNLIEENVNNTPQITQDFTDNDSYNDEPNDMLMETPEVIIPTKDELKEELIDTNIETKQNVDSNVLKEKRQYNKKPKKNKESIEAPEEPLVKRANDKWDDNLRKQFLVDCEKYSLKEVSERWGLTKGSVYSARYQAKKSLAKSL